MYKRNYMIGAACVLALATLLGFTSPAMAGCDVVGGLVDTANLFIEVWPNPEPPGTLANLIEEATSRIQSNHPDAIICSFTVYNGLEPSSSRESWYDWYTLIIGSQT